MLIFNSRVRREEVKSKMHSEEERVDHLKLSARLFI